MKIPNFRQNKGITLAALVITIIVLLIIATITISTLSGNNGIVEKTITAKEESEIKSELKVVDLASNQAKNRNKYGDVTGEELIKALKYNAGENQTDVKYYEKGSAYFVTFKKSNRVYEVTTAGYVKYIGKPEDAVVIFSKPKSSITPKTEIDVNITIKTLLENKIDKLEYVWNQSEDKQPSKEEYTPKVLEKRAEDDNTEKGANVKLENVPDGEYYLWVKVTNNGEDKIEHLGPYIIGEVSFELAVDPNGGKWKNTTEVTKIKQKNGMQLDLDKPEPPTNHEITFDAAGGNVSKDKETSVVSFEKWDKKGVGTLEGNIFTFGKGKATVTAQYSNSKITLPTATKDGHKIDGWFDEDGNKAGEPNDEYTPKGSEKLTAHWTPNSYVLAFDYRTNGGTRGPDETQQVVYGKKVILTEITAEKPNGYQFIGWNKNANARTALEEITMGAQNEKVYALFKKDIRLTFKDKNGDKYSNPDPVTIYNNDKGTATAPEISEYTGWEPLYWTKDTKVDGAKAVGAKTGDNTISNITDPATYYARYKKDITIKFDLNGGTSEKIKDITGEVHVSTSDITKPKGVTVDLSEVISGNEPTRTGYAFTGWNTSADGKGTTYNKDENISFTDVTTLYAQWKTSTYTVEYYQGNNSTTEGSTKFTATSSHTYGTASALKTYEQLGGTAPSGWTFAGWSTSETGTAVSTVNSVSLTDGASVTNLTNTANGTVKLYAIFKRNIVFKSGANAEKTDATSEQRYNPYKTTGYITSVTSPSALTAITGWTGAGAGTGYRNDATAGAATIGFNASVTPAYNETALTYYGVYTKVINVYSGVSKGTNNKQTQYLNTNGNKVSSISLAVPAAIENWTAIGYRDDTTADDKETAVTTSAVSVTPAYSTSAISYYAVYSRTLTIKYNGNEATSGSTSSTTKTVYLNTNSTTTSSQQVTLANNGFIKNGYMFSKWAVRSTDGTQYAQGASYTAGLAYNASSFEETMYAIWQDVYLRKSEEAKSPITEFLGTTLQRGNIKKITFENSIAGHTVDGATCFDVSSIENSGQVLLWITNTDENGYYDIVIGQEGGVRGNPDSSYLFSFVGFLARIPFTMNLTGFNTSGVTNMSYMFNQCGYLATTSSLDLGDKFDTSSVTNMQNMFNGCGYTAMTSLDLGDKFDTSKVTNMSGMFCNCGREAMTSLDLGDKFDTSKVTDMSSMFSGCGYKAMTNLDLGDKFDTSNVTNMQNMFYCCGRTAMTSLDLGDKFDTSNVTNMSYMFASCGYTAMTSLDLGDKFDTSSVTNMNSMFGSCGYTAMTSLDLGDNFDTSSVTDMGAMFASCGYTVMTSLDLGDKFDTSSVTNMNSMFGHCGYIAMTSLDLGDKFNTSSVTDMSYMFNRCGYTAMTSLDLGDKFDTSNVTDMVSMFECCGCTAMQSLDLGEKFDTSKVTNMIHMFASCGYTAMTSLDLGDKFDTSSVTNMSYMFTGCGYKSMTSLDLGDKFDTSNVTNMSFMFNSCRNLVTIYATESFVTTNVTNGSNMFTGDTKLVGGMGTVFDSNHIDQAYAHVDEGTTNPGYFTDKNTYYVEFDANGGTGTMPRQPMIYGKASNLSTNTFTKPGYAFAGWNDKADGSGTSYTDGQSVLNLENGWKKVKKLYAQWKVATTLRKSEQNINSTEETFLYTTIKRSAIKSITFANSIAGHIVDETTCFDVSSIENSGQVLLWITDDSGGYYDIVIGQEGGVIANPDSSYLFCNVGWGTPLTIDFTNFYTSGVTNMSCMFESCGYQAMTSLDLGNEFDTSSVTNMLYMFYNCGSRAMTSLNLGDKFDTSNVTNMRYMFYNCGYTAMTSLDLGDKFDTSSVTDMIAMFQRCGYREMTSLDLGDKFDTSNVMHMWYMFYECGYRAMTSLDLGDKFDTSNVIDMHYMFNSCGYTALTSLDLGDKFDTSNVTNMDSMFESCGHGALTELDISAMTFPNTLTQHSYIFRNCGKSDCQVYVKSATEKTWVETKKNTDWSNSNIIVGHLN